MSPSFSDHQKPLHSWHFQRPRRLDARQPSLFVRRFDDWLAELEVSRDELKRWADRGWLSFDPDSVKEVSAFGDERVLEVQFIRDFSRSGLSDAQLLALADCAGTPLNFDPARVTWSFSHGWVEPKPCHECKERDSESHVDSGHEEDALVDASSEVQRLLDALRSLIAETGDKKEQGQ